MTTPPPEEFGSLHIVELRSENVKRLRAVTIRPDGRVVTLGGDNDQGKTSVLQSIEMALGGGDQIIEEPIRRGAKKARVVLDLGDIVVTRTFTKQGSTLVVTGKDGTPRKSPQELLNRLTNAVTFDPFGFTLLKPAQQAEILRGIVKLDFSALEAARQKAFGERTLVNRDLDQQKALVARLPFHKDAPAAEESSTAILVEIDTFRKHNEGVKALRDAAEDANEVVADETKKHEDLLATGKDLRAQIGALQAKLAANEKAAGQQFEVITAATQKLAAATKEWESAEMRDPAPLTAKLAGLEAANAKVRANKQRADAEAAVKSKQAMSDALTQKIEACDEERAATLAATKFPVAGLSFGDNGVLLDGLPFSQAGDAEQIRVSVAIAAALNPKIRVMLIHDGSLIGTRKMELIRQLAEEHNLQVWIEVVSDKDDKKSSVVIEDGHVVGQEVVETEEPAAPAEAPASPPQTEKQAGLDLPPSR